MHRTSSPRFISTEATEPMSRVEEAEDDNATLRLLADISLSLIDGIAEARDALPNRVGRTIGPSGEIASYLTIDRPSSHLLISRLRSLLGQANRQYSIALLSHYPSLLST